MLLPQEIIRSKRNGQELQTEQIQLFVNGLVSGQFADAQVGAMAMAIFLNGMTEREKVDLTLAMMNSGTVIDWQGELDGPVVDKHSTGGVGDKVSLMLAPIVAACGVYVPMISGRGLGHTGGTTDKLEAIPGFTTEPNLERFKRVVKSLGTAIITQTEDLAPADKRLYSMRDITATVESIPLITASILSKKLASGLDALVMDVKYGNGAMMNNYSDAQALAQSIVSVANGAGVTTSAIITDMNQVLGTSAGNALEIVETVDYLTGNYRDARLDKVTRALAVDMLLSAKVTDDSQVAAQMVAKALDSGKAAEIFEAMVSELGGPSDFLANSATHLSSANVTLAVPALSNGYISRMETRDIGLAVVELGGGRTAPGQKIDDSVGFNSIAPIGAYMCEGEPLAFVHAASEQQAQAALSQYQKAVTLSEDNVEADPVIYETIR